MSGHCKDCRWWKPNDTDGYISFVSRPDWGVCEMTTVGMLPVHPESLAFADDEYLVTSPEFGCVQFAAADEAPATLPASSD